MAQPLAYLDSNATTKPDPGVVEAMLPFLQENWGNPSSAHRMGQRARAAVDEARAKVAALVGCRDRELTFTGGGTEASNTAIRGLFHARRRRDANKTCIVTTAVEHSATREVCHHLRDHEGAQVIEVGVDELGRLDLDAFADALTETAALATVIWGNNETGVVTDIEAVAKVCGDRGVPLHVDATQCIGKIGVDLPTLGCDAATLAGHKFHGPKGVGALYLRRGVRIEPLIIGGPQERDRRGGTENVPGIVGMGQAARLAGEHLADMPRVAEMRDEFERRVLEAIQDVRVNGDREHRLPNTTNLGFARLEAEAILLMLSEAGVCASAGAACSSGSLEPSHVLRAMGVPETLAHGSLRFSLSRFTTRQEIEHALSVLPGVIGRLRSVLPVGY